MQRAVSGVKLNIIDRAWGYFSPAKGVERLRARYATAILEGYTGASKSRRSMSGWKVLSGDSDSDVLTDLPTLRERSRDLIRNAPLATGAINTKVTSIVGTGLRVQSRIDRDYLKLTEEDADQWEASAEREFRMWAESQDCDVERTLNFYEYQELALRSTLENGDIFIIMPSILRAGSPYGLKIQAVEADRVCNEDNKVNTATLSGGIERDSSGAPYRYHITNTHPGSIYKYKGDWTKVRAFGEKTGRRNVLHLYKKLRVGQTRGIPDLAPVIETLKQLDRYTDAEINSAVISSFFTVFIKSPDGTTGLAPMTPTSETGASESDDDMKLASGAIIDLADGEDVTFADPSRPNQAFDPFVMAVLRQIGTALELPFEILIKHFTASYSASQAAMLEAWRFFMTRRKWLSDNLCDPIYESFIYEAVLLGRIHAPGFIEDPAIRRAYLGTVWIGPAKGQIDEMKAVNAATARIDEGLSTRSDEAATLGKDFDVMHKQRVKEERMRKSGGLSKDAYPDALTLDEKREKDGKPPTGNTDAVYMSSSVIPAVEIETPVKP